MIVIQTSSIPIHLYLEPSGYPKYSPDYLSVYPTLREDSEDATLCHPNVGACGDCSSCPLEHSVACSDYSDVLAFIISHYPDQFTDYPELIL